MALPPFKQSQIGKILLGVSIFFVVLFAVTLIMNWISNPDMFKPVFGG
jgi:multisubunit Na+/H+ antiporter MnhB subunit